MSTVAFLASVVDPRVASAAAKAALGENTVGRRLISVYSKFVCGSETIYDTHNVYAKKGK